MSNDACFPPELVKRAQWVGFTVEWDEKKGKYDKYPINPHTGHKAKSNDPGTWGTLEQAQQCGCNYVGYALTKADNLTCIDPDTYKLTEDDEFRSLHQQIVEKTDSYIEASVSGAHKILVKGTPTEKIDAHEVEIEVFTERRFILLTGQTLPGKTEIKDGDGLLARLQRSFPAEVMETENTGDKAGIWPPYLEQAARQIPADDYCDWLQVGMAFHCADPVKGRKAWDEWSRSSGKFDASEQDRKWHSFGKGSGRRLSAFYIMRQARRAGWEDPAIEEGRQIWEAIKPGLEKRAAGVRTPDNAWLKPIGELLARREPIRWLVKKWVQEKSLCMVFGATGCGKTMVVLDIALRVATGGGEWFGRRAKPGRVVYLAGEGHIGVVQRVAAWLNNNDHAHDPDLFVSDTGLALDEEAPHKFAVEAIRGLGEPPKLVVVDTLHRFMGGHENDTQDAGTMIRACDQIKQEFGCTVLLVHHTGLQDPDRSRGNSGFKGALETEIKIARVPDGTVVEIANTKQKDAPEQMPESAEIVSAELPDWFDEDGEPVISAFASHTETAAMREQAKEATYRAMLPRVQSFIRQMDEQGRAISRNQLYNDHYGTQGPTGLSKDKLKELLPWAIEQDEIHERPAKGKSGHVLYA